MFGARTGELLVSARGGVLGKLRSEGNVLIKRNGARSIANCGFGHKVDSVLKDTVGSAIGHRYR